MKILHQYKDGTLQVMKYTLPNGKEVALLVTDKRICCYQHWPDNPWEPFDPEILLFTQANGMSAEEIDRLEMQSN